MTNGIAPDRPPDGTESSHHSTTDRLARRAHETVDRVARSSAEAETRLREQAEVAADKVRETEQRARQAAERSADNVAAYIQDNPLLSAGIAFVAGVFLSGLLRR